MNRRIPTEIINIVKKYKSITIKIDNMEEKFDIIESREILKHYLEQRELFDYDYLPFAVLDDDYLCLDFNKEKVKIVYWSSERVLEDKNLGIWIIYNSVQQFLDNILIANYRKIS